ncbi:hypothetical protein Nepgr_003620 [Nepenthes gracilis]|uniref:Uncharacterized protein n=1 Tax=Nepenthes gracilis TaxID=150966 RepID=A0AAD3RZU9_NEPGR|nr:hypothetical protein Nepgr_003620 [Nepenthes gracilis]
MDISKKEQQDNCHSFSQRKTGYLVSPDAVFDVQVVAELPIPGCELSQHFRDEQECGSLTHLVHTSLAASERFTNFAGELWRIEPAVLP